MNGEPFSTVVRSGSHPEALVAFGWLMDNRPDAAHRAIAKLSDADRDIAARAACLLLAALDDVALTCQWCDDPDCSDRFEHQRLESMRETGWRKR